jgi:hypothetical protein
LTAALQRPNSRAGRFDSGRNMMDARVARTHQTLRFELPVSFPQQWHHFD